jgi:hypothetical protein
MPQQPDVLTEPADRGRLDRMVRRRTLWGSWHWLATRPARKVLVGEGALPRALGARCCQASATSPAAMWPKLLEVPQVQELSHATRRGLELRTARLTPKLSRIAARSRAHGMLFVPCGWRSDAISA